MQRIIDPNEFKYPYPISLANYAKSPVKIAKPDDNSDIEEPPRQIPIDISTSHYRRARKFKEEPRELIAAPLLAKPLRVPFVVPTSLPEEEPRVPGPKPPVWRPDRPGKPNAPIGMAYSTEVVV